MPFDINQYIDTSSHLFQQIIFILKIISAVASLLMAGFIVYALVETTWLKRLILWDMQEFLTYKPHGVRKLYKQWQKVKARLETGMESEYKLAVVEADSVLDDTLKRMGFMGETLGERLEKVTEATVPNLESVLEAHKIRNSIVHDPDYRLELDNARNFIDIYEKALSDLQAL